MDERTLPRLRRALVLTLGTAAGAIAEQAQALGQAWLGLEPPWVRLSLAPELLAGPVAAETLDTLAEACDRLADGVLMARLRQAGWVLTKPDEIEIWLICETARPPGALGQPGALLAAIVELAWRRLRVHVTLRGLLLAEPAQQELAAAWAAQLAAAGVEQIGLAGPVTVDRLRWAPARWQARAACGLAALLWSNAELGSVGALAGAEAARRPAAVDATVADAERVMVWGIGAAAWPTPLAHVMPRLTASYALHSVQRMLDQPQIGAVAETADAATGADCCGAPDDSRGVLGPPADGGSQPDESLPPWELPALAIAPERHRLAVAAAVPAEPAGLVWGQRRPAWWSLATLPATLRAAAERRAAQAHDEQFGPRGLWLEGQLTGWSAAQAQLRDARLAPAHGWPALARYQAELRGQVTQLRAACARIEEWLEEAGARFTQAEAEVTRTECDLAELCDAFPAPNRRGLLPTLLRPWRWLELAWAYLALLPQAGQRYLDACYRRGEARWGEANIHTLRQVYLAMTQIVQEHQRAAAALGETLARVAEELAQMTAAALPWPWDAARIDELALRQTADSGPGVDWARGATTDQPAALDRLLAWTTARLAPLADQTAADWLTTALDEAGLARWLESQHAEAAALWPAVGPEAEAITWLLCPAGKLSAAAKVLSEARLQTAMQAWATQGAAGERAVRSGVSGPDVLLVLHTVQVCLEEDATVRGTTDRAL